MVRAWVSNNTLRWRHNGHDCVSNHQPRHCLLNRLFERSSKKTSKLRVTGLCVGNSPGTGEFPAQRASYAKNVSIWWRHHDLFLLDVISHPFPYFNGTKPPLKLVHGWMITSHNFKWIELRFHVLVYSLAETLPKKYKSLCITQVFCTCRIFC